MGKASSFYICTACKEKFQFEDIRYSSDGKRILCTNCYDKIMKEQKREEGLQNVKAISDSVKLICNDCGYRFSIKRGSHIRLICPYCSGNQIIKDDITAEKLIQEISQANLNR